MFRDFEEMDAERVERELRERRKRSREIIQPLLVRMRVRFQAMQTANRENLKTLESILRNIEACRVQVRCGAPVDDRTLALAAEQIESAIHQLSATHSNLAILQQQAAQDQKTERNR